MRKFNNILLIDDDRASNYLAKALMQEIGSTVPLHITTNSKEAIDL